MITKGYIVGKSKTSSNKYLVRIPIFESAGVGTTQGGINTSISECTLSHNPGTYEALKDGDCVFISFEDNLYSKPVIIGKLYLNIENEASGFQYNTNLRVTNKATLPQDTTIGNVRFDSIVNYFNALNTAIDKKDLDVNSIQFKTSNVGAGKMFFDDFEGVPQVTVSPNVTMAMGIDALLKVYNDTDYDMFDGQVVYRTGQINGVTKVKLAIANSHTIANRTIGIVTERIPSHGYGFISRRGYVGGLSLPTPEFNENDTLYLSPTEAGSFTTIKPLAPSFITEVGYVNVTSTEGEPNSGQIYVNIDIVPISSDISYDNSGSHLLSQTVKGALDELSFTKVDVGALSSNINLYPTSKQSPDIPGYYHLVSSTQDVDYDVEAYDMPYGGVAITGNNQLVAELAADPGLFVGNPGVIAVTTIGNIRKMSGNSTQYGEFFFRLYHRTAGGVETLIGESGTTGPINPSVTSYFQFNASANLNNGAFEITDRVVIKYFANLVGHVGAKYQFQFGGATPTKTLLPVPVNVIPVSIASGIVTDVTKFTNILSTSDDDVQEALETLDVHTHPAQDIDDATTVGKNLLTLTNPSAVRYLRVNEDNTITTLTADELRLAIGSSKTFVQNTLPAGMVTDDLWFDTST